MTEVTSATAQAQGERTEWMRPVSLPWNAATPASSSSASGSASASSSPSYSCFEGHSEWISSGVLLSDHSTLITASFDCTVKFWNLRGADNSATTAAAAPASNCVATIARHTDYVQSLAYSAFNQTLVTAGLNFQLFSWRITPTGPRAIEDLSGGGNPYSPFAATATTDAGNFGMHEFDQLRGSFYSTALSATGDTLVTGSSDEIVRIYDTRSGSATRSSAGGSGGGGKNWLKLLGHQETIRAVAISESVGTGLSHVYSASAEGSLKVWDLRAQKCVNTFYPSSNDASVRGATAASAGRRAQSALIPLDRQVDLRERMRIQSLGAWASSSSSSHPLAALTRSAATAASASAGGTNPSRVPAIWCMVLNAACTLAFTAGASPVVFVTDLSSGSSSPVVCFRSNALCPTASSIVTLTLDETNALLWVGAWDGTVSAWDVSAVLRRGAVAAAAAGLGSVRSAVAGESRRSHPSSGVAHGRRKDVPVHSTVVAPDDDEEEEESAHGVFPLLLSSPKLLLPLSPLPPMEKGLLLHDRVHVVAQHLSNSWSPCLSSNAYGSAASAPTTAFAPASSASLHPPPLIFSTWNIIEGVCLDVMRVDGSLIAGASSGASEQGLWSLESLAEMLNAEFGRKANAHLAAINTPPAPTTPTTSSIATPKAGKGKDVPAAAAAVSAPAAPAPIASSKLVSNWCSIDVRFGCITVSLERRHCFAADLSKWFAADLQALPLLLPAAAAAAHAQLPAVAGSSSRPNSAKSGPSNGSASSSLATTLGYSSLFAASFTASARANLGEQLLFTLFSEWILIEDRLVVDAAAQRAGSGRNATPRSSMDEASSSNGVFVRKGPLLLRPVPPSSRVLARFLFPDTITHAFAGSSVLLARHRSHPTGTDGIASQQPVSARGSSPAASRQHQAMSAPGPNALSTPASLSVHASAAMSHCGVGTTLTLLIVPPKSSAFVAQALSLPILSAVPSSVTGSSALTPSLGASASRSSFLAMIHRARNAYLRVVPSWVEGVLFAPGSASSPQPQVAGSTLPVECERDRRSIVEQESASEGEEWIRKCKQMQAALLPAKPATPAAPLTAAAAASIHSIASAGARASGTFGRPSTPQLAPPAGLSAREPTDNVAAAPSSILASSKPQSQDLPVAEDDSPKATETTSSVSSNTVSTPSRRGTAVPPSPRYAPQALTPSTPPLLLAAAAAAAATNSGLLSSPLSAGGSSNPLEHRIQFQLLPLPSATGGHATHADSIVRRLHFGAGSGASADDHDDPEDSSFDSSSSTVVPALPSVTTGNMLVVPAGLTVRRLLAYVCQRLWKASEHSWMLPPEMCAQIQAQKAASALAREQQSPPPASGAAAAAPIDTRSKTPLVTPSKAAGVAGLGSPAAGGLSATSLTPSAIHLGSAAVTSGGHQDSPSKLRREVSLSMMSSVAHWERHTAVSPTPASPSPASPTSPSPYAGPGSAGLFKMPEHFLSLVLLNPVTGASQLLSADMEIGSVKEVMWSKMRRMTAQSGLLAVTSATGRTAAGSNPKRASNSTTNRSVVRGAAGILSSPSSPPPAEAHSTSGGGGSRLMTLYYSRTPAGEEWAQSQMRGGGGVGVGVPSPPSASSGPAQPGTASIRGAGALDGGLASLKGASGASNPILHQSASRLALRASHSRRDTAPTSSAVPVDGSAVVSTKPSAPAASASSASVVLPAIPRIVPSVQTATNLPIAVPMHLPQSASSSSLPTSSPRRSSLNPIHSGTVVPPSSTPASAVGPLLSPSARSNGGSSGVSSSRLPLDPMSPAVSSGILSRHKTAGSAQNAASK